MYDSLEGLDYEPGECSHYVSKILNDVAKSTEKGDIVEVSPKEVKKGDVVVGRWSSKLVVEDDYISSAVIPQKSRRDEQNGIALDPLVLIIKDETIRRLQKERRLKHT